jgi:hypothetical protein
MGDVFEFEMQKYNDGDLLEYVDDIIVEALELAARKRIKLWNFTISAKIGQFVPILIGCKLVEKIIPVVYPAGTRVRGTDQVLQGETEFEERAYDFYIQYDGVEHNLWLMRNDILQLNQNWLEFTEASTLIIIDLIEEALVQA